MKKITLLVFACLSTIYGFSQWANVVLPAQVKTSANGGGDVNTYTVAFDYTFADEADLNTMAYAAIRIRPISAPGVKDGAADNTDLTISLPDFKTYVLANGFTGSYSVAINMPEDAALATSASRAAANAGYGYDTRLQWGYGTANLQSTFVAIEVLDSSGTLSTKDFSITKLQATFYSSNRDAIIVNDRISGKFTIYNLIGQSVLTGEISNRIGVETLKSGLYILSTKDGVLKFAK
jgi:hypothetical protein